MSADLNAVNLGPDMIGMVNHPMRQPKQSLLNGSKMLLIGHRFLLFHI